MKLKQNREHFRAVGSRWLPKRDFISEDAAREAGFRISVWRCYQCSFCHKYHVAKRSRENDDG